MCSWRNESGRRNSCTFRPCNTLNMDFRIKETKCFGLMRCSNTNNLFDASHTTHVAIPFIYQECLFNVSPTSKFLKLELCTWTAKWRYLDDSQNLNVFQHALQQKGAHRLSRCTLRTRVPLTSRSNCHTVRGDFLSPCSTSQDTFTAQLLALLSWLESKLPKFVEIRDIVHTVTQNKYIAMLVCWR